MTTDVTLCLASHTNVGKTTLARTLLRKDVGTVADQVHVTDISEAHVLIRTADARLLLWDTPGFGDTVRLLRRLKAQRNWFGWLMHQVYDRFANRPLYCTQEAIRTTKEEADVVLYQVSALEDPKYAAFIEKEIELLQWIGHPVLVLLNYTGRATVQSRGPAGSAQVTEESGEADGDGTGSPGTEGGLARSSPDHTWEHLAKEGSVVRGILPLDAHARCWVQEGLLFKRIAELLEGNKADAMRELARAWSNRNLEIFMASCDLLADFIARVASDREPIPESKVPGRGKKKARESLAARLNSATKRMMEDLIAKHGLSGTSAARIEERVEDFKVAGQAPFGEGSGSIIGAVLGGALAGLAADLMAGGLTFGGGAVIGAIAGLLAGRGVGKAFKMLLGKREPTVGWSAGFLDEIFRNALLRYVAVAHFGRGYGEYRDLELATQWQGAVARVFGRHAPKIARLWKRAEKGGEQAAAGLKPELARLVERCVRELLLAGYPEAATVLEAGPLTVSKRKG